MSLQTCVERLFTINSNYLYPEQALNQALSLETLSSDLYTDPFRFLYELIQNADDAGSTSIQIALIDKTYLVVAHQGKVFDEKDVRGLCAVGNGSKNRDQYSTGYKELGFKAVFGKSRDVLIVSNGEIFRFDASHQFQWTWTDINQTTWENEHGRTFLYPWHLCPIWTSMEDIPPAVASWLSNHKDTMKVATVIRLENVSEARSALKELTRQPHMFLFLRYINSVHISTERQTTSSIRKEEQENGSVRIYCNNELRSQWLIRRFEVATSHQMRRDHRLPDKLRHMTRAEIGLAAKIDISDGESIIPVQHSESILFAYMPTKISAYNFPLLVNTNFLTSANREQIHTDSTWNQGLFSLLPQQITGCLMELTQHTRWQRTAYELIPRQTDAKDILAIKYNESCSQAIAHEKFIRTINGDYLSVKEVILDLTQLSQQPFVGNDSIRQFILHSYEPTPNELGAYPFVAPHDRLHDLGITKFDWDSAIKMLESTSFQQQFSIERCKGLIEYIFEHRNDEAISKRLDRLPFIIDQNRRLRTTTGVYFPLNLSDVLWNDKEYSEACVHNDLMSWLTPAYQNWLTKLGITVKTNLSYVHRTIIPNASTFITTRNASPTIRKLFFLFRSAQIPVDDLKKLNTLSLLTLDNRLVPAEELYLSAAYQPHLALETYLAMHPRLFVNPSYMHPEELCCQWKYFFLLIGVQEDIELIVYRGSNGLLGVYQYDQTQLIFGLGSQLVHRYEHRTAIRFVELTENNYPFAVFFWKYVMQQIDVHSLLKSELVFWGKETGNGMKRGSEVNNFPYWFVRTRPCIPVTSHSTTDGDSYRCLRAPDVFSSQLSYLIGHYLPIFECDTPVTTQWQQFFRFKTELSIEDHLYVLQQIELEHPQLTECDAESDRRIQYIYANLLQVHLFRIDEQERQFYRDRYHSMSLRLLSTRDHRFIRSEELDVWLIDSFSAPSRLHTLKLNRANREHAHLEYLLDILNVHNIRTTDLTFRPVNPRPCDTLRHELQSPHLLQWFALHGFVNVDLAQLSHMNFFEADRIEVYVKRNTMYVDCTAAHVEGNDVFIEGAWQVNSLLLQTLCELFVWPAQLLEIPWNLLISACSLDEYSVQLRNLLGANHPAQLDIVSSDTLEQLIERDNAVLFEQLGLSFLSASPAELLMAGLEAQESPWKGYVYHYTHLDNAMSILHDRSLKCRHRLVMKEFSDSAALSIIEQTDGRVLEHVRFYFRPRTPTQFGNENLGSEVNNDRYRNIPMCPVPVFFRISLRALLSIANLGWKVSLGTMARRHTEYGSCREIVERFDFCGVYQDSSMDRGKLSSQQEFLIESELDFGLISADDITLIFQDANARQSLELLCKGRSETCCRSEIDDSYFFGMNPRIRIAEDEEKHYVCVSMMDKQRKRDQNSIVIQVQSPYASNVACQGTVAAAFHDDHVTSIYGSKMLKAYISERCYAVYYIHDQQRWLIHTNHSQPRFHLGHVEQHPELVPMI